MNVSQKKEVFTLIELLVVISIIGLLASIILASLASARLKAQDARLTSEMTSLRTAAEMYRSANNNQYGHDNTGPIDILGCRGSNFLDDMTYGGLGIKTDLILLSKANNTETNFYCGIGPTSYFIDVKLPSSVSTGSDSSICIDSSGVLKKQPYTGSSGNYPAANPGQPDSSAYYHCQ